MNDVCELVTWAGLGLPIGHIVTAVAAYIGGRIHERYLGRGKHCDDT